MADFPTLADVLVAHRWSPAKNDARGGCYGCAFHGDYRGWIAHVEAEWVKDRTIETVEQLDALPLGAVVVDASGIPRTSRHGDSHMPGGWTHAGRSPLTSRELADGRPMFVAWHPERDR